MAIMKARPKRIVRIFYKKWLKIIKMKYKYNGNVPDLFIQIYQTRNCKLCWHTIENLDFGEKLDYVDFKNKHFLLHNTGVN